ncbi:M56 family metallopeptidase [Paenibacillus sp. FSL R7-0312]|uniref:M56 family metallopeptidase n=1 Tax=Paenibacillus sp. FSL R7-0312 TaxID=2921682 RepID=UPI0030F4D982
MMMNTLLEILFSLTVAGSIVSASIHALGWLSTELFPAKWRYGLIKLAVALYLFPIALIFPWLSQLNASRIATSLQGSQPAKFTGFISDPFQPAVILSAHAAYIILGIWAAGGISYAAWQLYGYRRFMIKLERTRTLVPADSETAILLGSIKEKLGLKSNVGLAYSPIARSPFLAGLWKPSIYLPAENGASLDMVLRHELIHLKRKDLWIKVLMLGVSALHWFNPMVHSVRKELHTWSELTCDQEVVEEMSHAERKRYGVTLLNVMAGSKGLPEQFYTPLSGDGKQLKRRLTHMLNAKKLKKQTIILSVAAVLLIAGISTSAAAWASKITPQVVADSEHSPTEAAEFAGADGSLIQPDTASSTVASESASAATPEGGTSKPAPEAVTVPAESYSVSAQEEPVAQPAPKLVTVTVPAESVTAPAQEGSVPQPVPEVVPGPADNVLAPAQEGSVPQPVPAELAAATAAQK